MADISVINMNQNDNKIRPLFIIGQEGCGKSTYIEKLAKKEKRVLLRCPCRKDRTLREQRSRIHEWALRAEPTLLWLEGTDDLTPEAQSFLRRILETYAPNVRFCLEGRTLSSIQEPILSRCDILRIPYSFKLHPKLNTLSDSIKDDIIFVLEKTNTLQSLRKQEIAYILSVYYPHMWKLIQTNINKFVDKPNSILDNIKSAENPINIIWREYETYPEYIQNDINKAFSEYGNPWAILAYARAASKSS
jgi:DNA polymerase III delta prime subunit